MEHYRTKKEMIYEILKADILSGKYAFGEKLIISRLAKEFKSSEIPVRESLNQLSAQNLVAFEPHVGAVVKSLSMQEVKDIFEIRVVLEGLATRLAMPHLTESDFNFLRNNIKKSKEILDKEYFEEFEALNFEFHNCIYEKSGNKTLIQSIHDFWSNTKRYPSLFKQNRSHINLSIKEHEHIYDSLIGNNGAIAESLMIEHKSRAESEMLSIMEKQTEKVDK